MREGRRAYTRGMEPGDLTVLSTFPSLADAQLAKGVLDEVGIECIVRTDDAGGMMPAIGGAQLVVRAEDVERANDALHRRHDPANRQR